jgi:hypothetical protein
MSRTPIYTLADARDARIAHKYSNEPSRYDIEQAAEINARADAISALQVGDGVTVSVWTDSDAYTIISRTATRMTLQQDKATLDPSWKPEWVAGGFAGHCTNQDEQSYTYERDPNGHTVEISLRQYTHANTERRVWKRKGVGRKEIGGGVSVGRHKFHDYNF